MVWIIFNYAIPTENSISFLIQFHFSRRHSRLSQIAWALANYCLNMLHFGAELEPHSRASNQHERKKCWFYYTNENVWIHQSSLLLLQCVVYDSEMSSKKQRNKYDWAGKTTKSGHGWICLREVVRIRQRAAVRWEKEYAERVNNSITTYNWLTRKRVLWVQCLMVGRLSFNKSVSINFPQQLQIDCIIRSHNVMKRVRKPIYGSFTWCFFNFFFHLQCIFLAFLVGTLSCRALTFQFECFSFGMWKAQRLSAVTDLFLR